VLLSGGQRIDLQSFENGIVTCPPAGCDADHTNRRVQACAAGMRCKFKTLAPTALHVTPVSAIVPAADRVVPVMRFSPTFLTPVLIAGAAAAAIAAATPAAASPLSCTDIGLATQCGSPGNSQITANTPPIQQQPTVIIIHRHR
jgi:hypothetical protein